MGLAVLPLVPVQWRRWSAPDHGEANSYQSEWSAWRGQVVVGIAVISFCLWCASGPAWAQQRVLGLDISAWQGNIAQTTWNGLRTNDNRQFVILRSSRGGSTGYFNQSDSDNSTGLNTLSQRYDDPYFVQNVNRATAAG